MNDFEHKSIKISEMLTVKGLIEAHNATTVQTVKDCVIKAMIAWYEFNGFQSRGPVKPELRMSFSRPEQLHGVVEG